MQNKTLFSRHFLDSRLNQQPEWDEDPRPTLERMRPLWAKARQYGSAWNEAQTEEEFIKPVLSVLGWSFIVQAKAGRSGQVTRPDYALFANEASKQEAYPHQGHDEAFYGRSLAIAEAKHWERPLSQKDASGRATWKAESNPSHQMVSYLVGTRTEWGILTNGVAWRLYSREVSSTASEFYEIDLGELFDFLPAGAPPSPAQVEQFKRWWLFFRRAAFTRQEGAQPFVQRVHEGSMLYAGEISERLKELVFEDVMPEIAGGFVAYRWHQMGIRAETPETLLEIYRASLSLLYKLLFLLYAEARALLPMDNPDYRANSLTALAQWAAEQSDAGRRVSEATFATPHYDALLALFRRVDRGDPSLGIPHYNGGLFNPQTPENRFLESHKLSDRAVGRAIDLLARDQGQPVDYAYISVRNLGAIYEGLLENRLRVADAADGQVQLVNDKGERKASGSYYTPDYIVEYIVEHTLDPILEARQADYAQAMEQIGAMRRQLAKATDPATNRRLQGELAEAERRGREAFLGIKVLDPAMGSGHFLVNAVDHLTDGIIQHMQAYHDAHPEARWDWDPIQALIERVRAEIVQEMAEQGLNVDTRRLDDTALLTRLVMKRCIYGVDLNRMAVELAKVSLWLHSFTVGAPLSFLDHHLRWGNSLIGAEVRTVEQAMRAQEQKGGAMQFTLFAGPFAGLLDLTAVMSEVAERADATLADVRQSAQAFETLQQALTPYKQALDLWVSQYFGNKAAKEFMELYGSDVLPAIRGERKVAAQQQAALNAAQALWQEKRFFHWDLEFPEVFVDLRKRNWAENPGFDAVVGNPPYIATGNLRDSDLRTWQYYKSSYSSASSGKFDIYLPFFERTWFLSNSNNGRVSFILPNKWIKSDAGTNFRELLVENTAVELFLDFGSMQVFQGVSGDKGPTTYTCICTLSKNAKNQLRYFRVTNIDNGLRELNWESVSYKGLDNTPWKLETGFWDRMVAPAFETLENSADIFVGTTTNADDVFIMDKVSESDGILSVYSHADQAVIQIEKNICIPFLRGKDLGKFEISNPNLVVLFPYSRGVISVELLRQTRLKKQFPLAWKYLERHKATLENRENGKWQGKPDWYCHAYPRNYGFIDLPKILTPDICTSGQFCLDEQGGYHFLNTAYGIANAKGNLSLKYLLCIVNSKIFEKYIRANSVDLRGGYYRVTKTFMSPFPIRCINFTTSSETRSAALVHTHKLYEQGKIDSAQNFALQHLTSQADIVHDLLSYLAEQMITLNKTRQGEMKGFLAWLEREIGVPLQGLTGKTTIQNYLGDYQKGEEAAALEDILAVLRKNQRKLGVQVAGRAFQERLAQEYQASLEKLLPIKHKLAATDRLIDQIVYALYGLKEEEIAVVEGRAT